MLNQGLFSSSSREWSTPDNLFASISRRFGPFDLDAAASMVNRKCLIFYSEGDDGLKQPWGIKQDTKVWLNPPYGRVIGQWIARCYEQAKTDLVQRVVALIPARTDTCYWHEYVMRASEVILLKGRVYFLNGVDKPHPAPFPSAIVIWERPTIDHPGGPLFKTMNTRP